MKPLTFLLLMAISLPIMMPEPIYEVGGYKGTGKKLESLGGKPRAVEVVPYDQTWDEHLCLAHNIWWEARGEGELGMKLIAAVTLNRVKSKKSYMKDTICGVVKTKGSFQWYSDGKSDRPKQGKSWELAKKIATRAMNGDYKNLTNSLYFKVCDYESSFFEKLRFSHKYKRHCFYTSD